TVMSESGARLSPWRSCLPTADSLGQSRCATPSVMIATFGASSRSASVNDRHAQGPEKLRPHAVEAEPRVRLRFGVVLVLRGVAAHPDVRAQEGRHLFGRSGNDSAD